MVRESVPTPAALEGEPAAEIRTFLIVDVRGYTRFTVEHGDEAAARLAARFADIVEETMLQHAGRMIELRGDEALVVFSSPRAALRGAADLQKRFALERQRSIPIEVGIGLDAGEAIPVKGGFRGAALNLAARLCSLAGRGEILASDALIHLARKIDGLDYVERGYVQLKGFAEAVKVIEVRISSPAETPAEERGGGRPTAAAGHAGDDIAPLQPLPIGGFLGSLPAGTLVGRDDVMERIRSALQVVEDGEGRLVVLAGEPGVGKTRLAQEVTLAARNRGFLVLVGTCYEPEVGTPFYPFLDVFSQAYAAAPAAMRALVPQQWPALGKLLPSQSIPVPPGAWSGREEQQRIFWAAGEFLGTLAAQLPVAILLDDLQWADGSTLSLLQHLARHTRPQRIFLLGNYRDVEVDRRHPLDAVLLDLSRQQLLERIAVHRLPEEGTAALLAHSLGQEASREFAALLHTRTEGNPFFVQEVLHSLVERGDVYRENGHWSRRALEEIEVPPSVRAVVGQRLAHLSEEAQTLLQEASVLGQTFSFDLLQRVNGRPEGEIEDALEDAVAAGLVRDAGHDTYAFNHSLTQQSLYAELSSRRKRRLHLAAGDVLEQYAPAERERRLAELALHFRQAEALERALPYTMQVGDRAAAAFAHDDAARFYHLALDLARQTGNAAAEAEAYEKLGGLLTETIRYREALEMLEPAARLFGSVGDRESEGRVVAQIGRVYFSVAAPQEGIARLEPAMAAFGGDHSPAALAGLTSVLGKLYFVRGRYREALACAEGAAELARRSAQGGVLAESEITRGSALVQLGHWRAGLQALEEAIAIAEGAGDVYSVCRALQGAAAVYLVQGDLERHRRSMDRALGVAERMHNQRQIAAATFGVFVNALVRGDWEEAHRLAERVLAVMNALGATWHAAFHLVGIAALAVAEGDDAGAQRYLAECLEVSGPTGDTQTFWGAQEVLAAGDLLAGDAAAARGRLEALPADGAVERDAAGRIIGAGDPLPGYLTGTGTYHDTGLLPLLARAYLAEGDTAQTETLTAAGIEGARRDGLRLTLVHWIALRAACLVRRERWAEAEAAFDEALQLCREIGYPYAEGRMRHELGAMWAARGDPVRARPHFHHAYAIFERLGARPSAALARTALDLR